jgi:Flp pilus assembly protein TadG
VTLHRSNEDGAAALELVLLAPVLFALLGLVVLAGRVTLAHQQVAAAAAQAARAAAQTDSPARAIVAARQAANTALHRGGPACAQLAVHADTGAFRAGGSVTVHVACTAQLSHLLPGLPGSHLITGDSRQPLDRFRQVVPAGLHSTGRPSVPSTAGTRR